MVASDASTTRLPVAVIIGSASLNLTQELQKQAQNRCDHGYLNARGGKLVRTIISYWEIHAIQQEGSSYARKTGNILLPFKKSPIIRERKRRQNSRRAALFGSAMPGLPVRDHAGTEEVGCLPPVAEILAGRCLA